MLCILTTYGEQNAAEALSRYSSNSLNMSVCALAGLPCFFSIDMTVALNMICTIKINLTNN